MWYLDQAKTSSMTYYLDNGIHFSLMLQWIWHTHQFQHFFLHLKHWLAKLWNVPILHLEKVSQQKCCKSCPFKTLQCITCSTRVFAWSFQPKQHSITWLKTLEGLQYATYKPFATMDDKELHRFSKHYMKMPEKCIQGTCFGI
jgi:hypothetical protein